MLRLAFDFIITWRETRTRPNAYILTAYSKKSQTLLHSNIENYIKSNRLIIFTQRFTYFFQPLPPYT